MKQIINSEKLKNRGGYMNTLRVTLIYGLGLLLIFGLIGCVDLDVENPNQPDAERAITRAEDIESLIGGSFLSYWGIQKTYPAPALSVAAWEYTSSWGNFGMQDMGTMPRQSYNNSPSYTDRFIAQNPWYGLYGAISGINDALAAIDRGAMDGLNNPARVARARAFGKFMQGISYGFLALMFDQAFLVDENFDLANETPEFADYKAVMDGAIGFLEEAAQISGNNAFQLPASWINERPLTNQELAALSHSFIARFMAMVSRTTEQRANAHGYGWDRVLAHAEQGITEDFTVEGDTEFWWFEYGWRGVHPVWTRASYYTIGPADQSGAYQTWLNTPPADRQPFLIVTDDKRITGDEPTDDGTDFWHWGNPAFNPVRGTYFFSFYGNGRYYYHLATGAAGPMPHLMKAELDMIKAEALIRTNGSKDRIAELINITRVGRGELEALANNLDYSVYMQQMMYEKNIEAAWTYCGRAYFDRRGWGTLVSGTPLHFPVPGFELEILLQPIYTFGGVGGDAAAPKVQAQSLQESMRIDGSPR